MITVHHDIQVAEPSEGTHEYNSLPAGTWFRGFGRESAPMLRVDGGYCSPVNGHVEHDKGTCYFVDKKVTPVKIGTKITIHVTEHRNS